MWRRAKHGKKRDFVLILTPVKDAMQTLEIYFQQIRTLTYPRDHISFGFLESDSTDNTFADIEQRLPRLRREFRRADLWKKDFGYQLPKGIHRGHESIQIERR